MYNVDTPLARIVQWVSLANIDTLILMLRFPRLSTSKERKKQTNIKQGMLCHLASGIHFLNVNCIKSGKSSCVQNNSSVLMILQATHKSSFNVQRTTKKFKGTDKLNVVCSNWEAHTDCVLRNKHLRALSSEHGFTRRSIFTFSNVAHPATPGLF